MRRGAEHVHAALMAADLRAGTGAGPYAGRPLREAMDAMVEHQRHHVDEMRSALSGVS